eukprot:5220326-Pyramimonas_sp.AAC.1
MRDTSILSGMCQCWCGSGGFAGGCVWSVAAGAATGGGAESTGRGPNGSVHRTDRTRRGGVSGPPAHI